jgi:tetratricopeptide (TPR) repeat protein
MNARLVNQTRIFAAVFVIALFAVRAGPVSAQESQGEERAVALLRMAEEQLSAGQFKEAHGFLTRAKALAPRIARTPYLLALCEYNLSLDDSNADRLVRAKRFLQETFTLDETWGEPFFFWGVISFSMGDYEQAVWGFENSLVRAHRPKDARTNLTRSLFKWGLVLAEDPHLSRADVERATVLFRDASERFYALKDDLRFLAEERQQFTSQWLDSLVNLAAMYQRSERLEEAEKVTARLIELQPQSYHHQFNMGLILGGIEEEADRALKHYRLALDLAPSTRWIEPYPMIGHILSNRAKTAEEEQEAETYFLRYLEVYPNALGALRRAGDHYRGTAKRLPAEREGEKDALLAKAINAYERCVEVAPGDLEVLKSLAETLKEAGRGQEAARWLSLLETLEAIQKEKAAVVGNPVDRPPVDR